MADPRLTKTRIEAGTWEGVLTAEGRVPPALRVMHGDKAIDAISVTDAGDGPGRWTVRVAIPASSLSDGVQTFAIQAAETGETLASFAVLAGQPAEDDVRAELALLRAELELLKQAFRRHCSETR